MRYALRQLSATTAAGYLASLGMLRICSDARLSFDGDLPLLDVDAKADAIVEQMLTWINQHVSADQITSSLDFKERNPLADAWRPFVEKTWSAGDEVSWTRYADGSTFAGTNEKGQWRHPGSFAVNGPGRAKPQSGLGKLWDPALWRVDSTEEISAVMGQGLRQILDGSMVAHYVRNEPVFFLTETDRYSTRRSGGAKSPIVPLWELLGAIGVSLVTPNRSAKGLIARHWDIPLTLSQSLEILLAQHSEFPEHLYPLVDAPGKSKAFGDRENTRA